MSKRRRYGIVIGEPEDLDVTQDELPTYRMVLKYYEFLRGNQELPATNRPQTAAAKRYALAKIIAEKLTRMWQRIVPAITLITDVTRKISRLLDELAVCQRGQLKSKLADDLEACLDVLFDISKCKCNLPERECSHHLINCKTQDCSKVHFSCECPAPKVPAALREFLKDQRIKIGPKGKYLQKNNKC